MHKIIRLDKDEKVDLFFTLFGFDNDENNSIFSDDYMDKLKEMIKKSVINIFYQIQSNLYKER